MNNTEQQIVELIEPIEHKLADTDFVKAEQAMDKPQVIVGTSDGLVFLDSKHDVELEGYSINALASSLDGLWAIAKEKGSAVERLHRWFQQLMILKRRKVLEDPQLFATYSAIAEEARGVVPAHVDELVNQLSYIIESGISSQEFKVAHAHEAAKAIFDATIRFHHPAHANEWSNPDINTDFAHVWRFVVAGLVVG